MDRRMLLAVVLMFGVIVITPKLFPSRPAASRPNAVTTAGPSSTLPSTTAPSPRLTPAPVTTAVRDTAPLVPATTVTFQDNHSTARLSSAGASLESVDMRGFKALGGEKGDRVQLSAGSQPLLSYRILSSAGDTTWLSKTTFAVSSSPTSDRVTFQGTAGAYGVSIGYHAVRDSFLLRVSGAIAQAPGGSFLLVDMPSTLRSYEADTLGDHASLAYAVRPARRSAQAVKFASLSPGELEVIPGPVVWAVAKSKYFMLGVLGDSANPPFAEARVLGGARTSKIATHAQGTLVMRLPADGQFAFEVYAGPQEYRRLVALGRDFENSNPYGGWLQGMVQPFATLVMKLLLWMKAALGWNYGALLVLFGIAVRMLLWPLNQKAMRTTLNMQRIQPELSAVQAKYKSDPQKMQSEIMRIYKENDMSPFSAFAGCLPILLPMPVLFALFFVFQNTIEFRGVSFLWLADISLKDPFYIIPLLMGASMFVLSWIGLRNSPPNPQAKMMAYVMPVMMTVLFANFASGLNLYYTVQNIAALPQQWLIANERAKAKA